MAMAPGQVLRLQADDPAAVIDVPHFCNENGHRLTHVASRGEVRHFFIERAAT